MKDWQNPVIPNIALGLAGGIELLKLNKASRNPRKESEKTLRRILTYAKDTVYGKEHHFDEILQATSAGDLFRRYRENVPMNDYEDFRP